MKNVVFTVAVVCLILVTGNSDQANAKFRKDQPQHYRFSYDVNQSGRIIEKSVCREYGGIDWKNCRRYAQWVFTQKCWDYRHKMRRTSREALDDVRKKMDFYCDAKSRVTPLG